MRCCAGRGRHPDRVGILVVGIFRDSDTVTSGEESIELRNEHGVALEEIGYTLDNARCIDPLEDERAR